jgi:hypothetical protein
MNSARPKQKPDLMSFSRIFALGTKEERARALLRRLDATEEAELGKARPSQPVLGRLAAMKRTLEKRLGDAPSVTARMPKKPA